MRAAFLKLMTQTVTYEPYAGPEMDGGKPTYSTPVTLEKCRVEPTSARVLKSDGEEVVANNVVYVGDDVAVTENGRLTLPDASQCNIARVAVLYDTNGTTVHHREVYAV